MVLRLILRHDGPMSETPPQLRVGDRERRAVDERLLAAVGDGVLTLHEYDERSAVLWQSRTRDDLDALTADLPGAAPPARRAVPAGPVADARVIAVMSEDRFAGALVPGQDVTGYSVMGKAVLDLRREDLPDGVRVRVRAVMGEVEVQVPRGSVVHLSGMSVMGERKVAVDQGAGPVVHVDAVSVMGTVKVTQGDGTVVAADGRSRALPAPVRTSVAVPKATGHLSRSGHGSRSLGRLKGLLVPAGVLGAVLLAGPDAAAVFSSTTERVQSGDDRVQVSALFGTVTVVVPDDVRVDPGGLVVFGSTTCAQACEPTGGTVVDVVGVGAFGEVAILTRSELAERQAADARERAADEREERLEEQAERREDGE